MSIDRYKLYQRYLRLQQEMGNASVEAHTAIYGGEDLEKVSDLIRKAEELRDQCDQIVKVLTGETP